MNLITHSLFIIIISLAKTRNPCKLSLTRVILFFVPRPAFEIIKVGKMWVKRKMRKNATITLYFNML